MNDFVAKPFKANNIHGVIKKWVLTQEGEGEALKRKKKRKKKEKKEKRQ